MNIVKAPRPNRTVMTVVALGMVVLAAAAGLSLVQSIVADESTATVAREAQIAIGAESTLSSAAAARNAIVQAAIVVGATDQGIVDIDQFVEIETLVRTTLSDFSARSRMLADRLETRQATAVSGAAAVYVRATFEALAAILDTEVEFSVATDGASHSAALALVNQTVVSVRDSRVEEVLLAGEAVGSAADAVRFLVIFVVPLAAMIAFRRSLRKRREHDRLALELAHQKDVISAKDQFIASLSHELRTPLTSIYGFAHLLSETATSDEDSSVADLIIEESAQLGRMVDDLITAGQIDASGLVYAFADVSVAEALHHVLATNPPSQSEVTSDVGRITVKADRQRLEHVLTNLIANADSHGGNRIDVTAIEAGTEVRLRVTDDGAGLDAARAESLFEKYVHRGEAPLLTGTIGMGLSVAAALVDGMDGTLTYHRIDEHTIFEVTLPATARDEHESHSAPEPLSLGAQTVGSTPT